MPLQLLTCRAWRPTPRPLTWRPADVDLEAEAAVAAAPLL